MVTRHLAALPASGGESYESEMTTPISEPLDVSRPVKLSLRVPADFRRKLRVLAAGQDSDMQAMVVDALVAMYPELR